MQSRYNDKEIKKHKKKSKKKRKISSICTTDPLPNSTLPSSGIAGLSPPVVNRAWNSTRFPISELDSDTTEDAQFNNLQKIEQLKNEISIREQIDLLYEQGVQNPIAYLTSLLNTIKYCD